MARNNRKGTRNRGGATDKSIFEISIEPSLVPPSTAPVAAASSVTARPHTASASTNQGRQRNMDAVSLDDSRDDTDEEGTERKKAKTNPFGVKIVDCFPPTYKKGGKLRGACIFCKRGMI